ncbi:YceD family protein [Ideonella sp. BN130291]|uniref:YceD family protein n=1 Tax=Ideonella sp. BN130291 TaxID=3112940 RepID=UPI002E263AB2|nr:YceD family protein [Ideonella sp. BN130291]
MKQRVFDPFRLDVPAFAADAAELDGQWPLTAFPRLAEAGATDAPDGPHEAVQWHARGESRGRRAGEPQLWLHLQADTHAWLQCQRCLQPMRQALAVERVFRFVRTEAEAEAEDPDSEEDVLALSRAFDLRALVEDELILELPLVPRHEVCPDPLPLPQSDTAPDPLQAQAEAAPHPFAKLAVLKRGKSSH